MRFVFYLSSDCFCGGGGFLTQISTDGVVRFMTDFHGFAAAGVSLTDFADFFAAVGYTGFYGICRVYSFLC